MGKSIGPFNLWDEETLWIDFCKKFSNMSKNSVCRGIFFNISSEFGSLLRNFQNKVELKSVLQYLVDPENFYIKWQDSVARIAIRVLYSVMNSDKVEDDEIKISLRLISIFLEVSDEVRKDLRKIGEFLKKRMERTIKTIDGLLAIESNSEKERTDEDETEPMAVQNTNRKTTTVRWNLSSAKEMKTHGLFHEVSKEPPYQPR